MRSTRSARALVATAVVTTMMILMSQAASGAKPASVPAGSGYVALGSSFASGPGLAITDPTCSRSSDNYPSLLAADLGLELTDVTCGGATVANVLDTSQFGRPPQIEAVTADTRLVTVTVGGNDVQYLSHLIRTACQADSTPVDDALAGLGDLAGFIRPLLCDPLTDADRSVAEAAMDQLTDRMVEMVQEIRTRAPHARIVLVDYVTIVPQSGKTCAALPITKAEAGYFLDVARQLQLATKHAAQRSGAELVEASKASRGHDACSSDPWVFGWEFDNILAGGAKAFHPNAAGMAAVADLIGAHVSG